MNIREYMDLLALAVSLYHYEDAGSSLKPLNTPQSEVMNEYDFIIVGAGTAGCVLASRLTEIEHWRVLLIEAGNDEDSITDAPAMMPYLFETRYDWNYSTVEQHHVCRDRNGRCVYPRGHVMGGSSSINGMFYVRGNKKDFDEWEAEGNTGWSFENVEKYFCRIENVNLPVSEPHQVKEECAVRGHLGPVSVQYSRFKYLTTQVVLNAALESGYEQGDYNGLIQERIGLTQTTTKGPSRQSAFKSYLYPIKYRRNLHVIKSSFVTKILFDDAGSAVGVQYVRDGDFYEVTSNKEVILSAGAINTPKLLLLSGVGPADTLRPLGIPIIQDLPVGKNLQDHLLARISISANIPAQVTREQFFSVHTIQEYAAFGQGPLTMPPSEILAFRSYLNESLPNGQWVVLGSPSPNNHTQVVTFGVAPLKPRARGMVTINSIDPFEPPLIDPRYLSDEHDRAVAKEIFRDVFRLLRSPTLKHHNFIVDPTLNSLCSDHVADEEKLIDCCISNQSGTYYHPVGTARMGPLDDGNAVVDSELNVYRVKKLRVIDASIMPSITRGNTNAPTFLIAEKGSDIIKQKYGVLV